MVTADRPLLCQRAIHCFRSQTHPNRELVVVDDGATDLRPLLQDLDTDQVSYVKLAPSTSTTLGELRNVALDHARGEYMAQWDDDDWYHPERLSVQLAALNEGYDACVLSGALMHLDDEDYFYEPYIGKLKGGVPGTIVHRKSGHIRYPSQRRAEDSVFLEQWEDEGAVRRLPIDYAYLFIRCFHGGNTWEKGHFLRRIRNSPIALMRYIWYGYLQGDVTNHPRFKLDAAAREAFELYLQDSRRLDLFTAASQP